MRRIKNDLQSHPVMKPPCMNFSNDLLSDNGKSALPVYEGTQHCQQLSMQNLRNHSQQKCLYAVPNMQDAHLRCTSTLK